MRVACIQYKSYEYEEKTLKKILNAQNVEIGLMVKDAKILIAKTVSNLTYKIFLNFNYVFKRKNQNRFSVNNS